MAARDLAECGFNVAVLEARDRVGGRAWFREFAEAGHGFEIGGAWFDPSRQQCIREEAERYGQPLMPKTAYRSIQWYTGRTLRGDPGVSEAERPGLEAALAEVRRAAHGLTTASTAEIRDHDVPVSTWLERLAIGPETRDYLYAWTTAMGGAEPHMHPMLAILHALAQKDDAYGVGVTRNVVLANGSTALADAIAADVRGNIQRATPVTAIRQLHNSVQVETTEGAMSAPLCILAVPINTIASIALDPSLDLARQHAVAEGNVCQVQKVWMVATGAPDRMLSYGWDTPFHAVSAEGDAGVGQLVVGFALTGRIDPADLAAIEAALRVYAPNARVIAASSHDWSGDVWSRGAWMSEPPGWVTSGLLDLLATPHGRIVMAGADIALESPGWMTGAIHSGRAAAIEAARMLSDG